MIASYLVFATWFALELVSLFRAQSAAQDRLQASSLPLRR